MQCWLNSVWEEQQQVPADFNWLGLAEIAAFKASNQVSKSQETREFSLIWAQIAISVYEFLANSRPNDAIQESFIESLMNLRSYMILQLGVKVGHSVLDPEPILNWFFENLEFSYEDTVAKACVWKKLFTDNISEAIFQKLECNLEELRALKKIKLRLRVIKLLLEGNQIYSSKVLQDWISLWEVLP